MEGDTVPEPDTTRVHDTLVTLPDLENHLPSVPSEGPPPRLLTEKTVLFGGEGTRVTLAPDLEKSDV